MDLVQQQLTSFQGLSAGPSQALSSLRQAFAGLRMGQSNPPTATAPSPPPHHTTTNRITPPSPPSLPILQSQEPPANRGKSIIMEGNPFALLVRNTGMTFPPPLPTHTTTFYTTPSNLASIPHFGSQPAPDAPHVYPFTAATHVDPLMELLQGDYLPPITDLPPAGLPPLATLPAPPPPLPPQPPTAHPTAAPPASLPPGHHVSTTTHPHLSAAATPPSEPTDRRTSLPCLSHSPPYYPTPLSPARSVTSDYDPTANPHHQIGTDNAQLQSSQRRRTNNGRHDIRPRLQAPAHDPFPHRRRRERHHDSLQGAALSTDRRQRSGPYHRDRSPPPRHRAHARTSRWDWGSPGGAGDLSSSPGRVDPAAPATSATHLHYVQGQDHNEAVPILDQAQADAPPQPVPHGSPIAGHAVDQSQPGTGQSAPPPHGPSSPLAKAPADRAPPQP